MDLPVHQPEMPRGRLQLRQLYNQRVNISPWRGTHRSAPGFTRPIKRSVAAQEFAKGRVLHTLLERDDQGRHWVSGDGEKSGPLTLIEALQSLAAAAHLSVHIEDRAANKSGRSPTSNDGGGHRASEPHNPKSDMP